MAGYNEDEYEVVPLTPLRRLEERIKKVEGERGGGGEREFVLDIMDLVKANQKLVDEVMKANSDLRKDVQTVVGKTDEVVELWRQFMELLKKAATEEAVPEGLVERFDKLIELNEQVIESNKKIADQLEGQRVRPQVQALPGTSKYPKIRVVR